jgi:protein TonB
MATALKSFPSPVYTCTFPGCPAPVKAHLSVIERLQAVVRSTAEDQQGILYGKPGVVGSEVLSSRALPVFDAEEMTAAIETSADSVIGYYRIREGTSLELTIHEIAIAAQLFSKPGSVVLLIERRPGQAEACFFFLEHGALLNYPLLRFPLDPPELARREAQRLTRKESEVEPAPPEPPAPPPVESPAGKRPFDVSPAPAGSARWRNLALIFGGAAVGFTLFFLTDLERRRPVPSPPAAIVTSTSPGTPLKAERQGADLKITWDLDSPAIANATSGLLNINDGGAQRQLNLNAEQVRFGGVLYSPTSDHVSIRLTTVKDDRSTSEASVIVLLNREPSRQLPRFDSRQYSTLRSDNGNDAKATAPALSSTPPLSDARDVSSRFQFESRPEAKTSTPVRPFVLPPGVARNSSAMSPQELPTVRANQPQVDVPVLPLSSLAPPAPTAPAPTLPAPTAPAATAPANSKPAAAPTPPVLTYDPGVVVPSELKQIIVSPVTVRVHVNVDAAGRVTRAEAVRSDRVHALLLSAATNAALRCRFRPARLGDTPVASEVTILFQVRP